MKKKKIVVITSRFPYPLDKGDKLRIYHQIKDMSSYHNIYLISLNAGQKIHKSELKEVKKYCKEVTVIQLPLITRIVNVVKSFLNNEPIQVGYFYSAKAHTVINNTIQETQPDWIYHQLIRTAKYTKTQHLTTIDYMDALSKGIERRIKNFPFFLKPLITREFLITSRYEKEVFDNFNKHIIITENDRNFIKHKKNKLIKVIPNGVDTNYFKPNENVKKTYDIVFVGNMSYPPNIEAAVYLCRNILPIIHKTRGTCNVLIAGTSPHKKVQNLKSKNITISGRLEDIREAYSSASVFAAPMFIGTGLQNKLLEAMAMGIPCVTTKLANNALLANSSQIITANNPEEFANACVKILNNEKFAKNLSIEALKFIQEKYDWQKINYKLSKLFN